MSQIRKKELQHSCKQNQHEDAEICYEKINQKEWGWILSQWCIATVDDVGDGHEGTVGAPMCSHHLLISYCPFCGENLINIEENTW
ncbi:MAG: hypothetical protein OEY86_16505 [Nitrospira sp.]|nr:hypothetical protein [Nitrospira sp.]